MSSIGNEWPVIVLRSHRPNKLILAFQVLLACMFALGQGRPEPVASTCVSCHPSQAKTQPATPMARALVLPDFNSTLHENQKLTFSRGAYSYSVDTSDAKSTYKVTDGTSTIELPIHWSFGIGAQTWMLEYQGHLYESLVSYYPAIRGLDITTGDEQIKPDTLEQAMGRQLTEHDSKACFGCHASNAVENGKLNLESVQPGLTCEHCHVGAASHIINVGQGELHAPLKDLSKFTSDEVSEFCGQCHRTWETVVRNRWRGVINVRFQPYRLTNSKCYDSKDPRISCLACHDPHRDLVREDAAYDSKCLACHATAPNSATTTGTPKSCTVAKSNCVSRHIPRVNMPHGHMTCTYNELRIVKHGEH